MFAALQHKVFETVMPSVACGMAYRYLSTSPVLAVNAIVLGTLMITGYLDVLHHGLCSPAQIFNIL